MTTKEQVIELAEQAGIEFQENTGITGRKKVTTYGSQPIEKIELLIKLVRNAALEQAKQLAWTEIMREGALVTWGDAETLGDRVIEKLESLKETT